MSNLEKKGYLLSIESWIGNLGNHLIQLSCAINVAKETRSKLTIPKHPLLRRRVFDFVDRDADNCYEAIVGRFFYQSDCFQFPIVFDRDRRKIFQDYVHDILMQKTLSEQFGSFVNATKKNQLEAETLVINIRSGSDIFRREPPPQNDYMQPPLSFYRCVIESNGYKDCLIVTEAARKNPCIDALMNLYPNVRIKKHMSVADDMRTLLSARHLVMCHSTFSWCMALMSRNLQRLYQPSSFQIKGVDDFSVDTYEFNNYIKPGEWTASNEQFQLMINHDMRDVSVVHRPAGSLEGREPEPSNQW